jgi:hypothetical protein
MQRFHYAMKRAARKQSPARRLIATNRRGKKVPIIQYGAHTGSNAPANPRQTSPGRQHHKSP